MNEYDWMDEARQLAAQCWCDKETEHIEMDVVLAEAVAKRIANWMSAAAMYARNSDYYSGLLDDIAQNFGSEAYTSDDGSVQEDPLRIKLPELVRKMRIERDVLLACRHGEQRCHECPDTTCCDNLLN